MAATKVATEKLRKYIEDANATDGPCFPAEDEAERSPKARFAGETWKAFELSSLRTGVRRAVRNTCTAARRIERDQDGREVGLGRVTACPTVSLRECG